MSLLAALKGKGKSGFGYGSTAEEVTEGIDLSGRTYLITGCNSGIGKETMRVLARRGAHIIAAARSEEKAATAAEEIGAEVTAIGCDLSAPKAVAAAAKTVRDRGTPVHGIIANAGIMALPQREVKHGLELHFLTNHLGHFILVTELLDQLADDGRVVVVSSDMHWAAPRGGVQLGNLDSSKGYSPWRAYGQSKLANLLFVRQLAKTLQGTGQTANAVHPGTIRTGLVRHANPLIGAAMTLGGPLVLKTIPQGAATQCFVAVHPKVANVSGEYFSDCNLARSSPRSRDMTLARRLWDESEKLRDRLLAEPG